MNMTLTWSKMFLMLLSLSSWSSLKSGHWLKLHQPESIPLILSLSHYPLWRTERQLKPEVANSPRMRAGLTGHPSSRMTLVVWDRLSSADWHRHGWPTGWNSTVSFTLPCSPLSYRPSPDRHLCWSYRKGEANKTPLSTHLRIPREKETHVEETTSVDVE